MDGATTFKFILFTGVESAEVLVEAKMEPNVIDESGSGNEV